MNIFWYKSQPTLFIYQCACVDGESMGSFLIFGLICSVACLLFKNIFMEIHACKYKENSTTYFYLHVDSLS